MKKKTIQGWGIIRQGIPVENITSNVNVYSNKNVAERNARILNGEIVPVEITYSLPLKKK